MIGYDGTITSNLYVIVWHRNHLALMSSGPLSESGGIYAWDFTYQLAKAFLDGQKDIGSGMFGMIGGDCNASGSINAYDENKDWSLDAGKTSNYQSDLILDTQVNNLDKDDTWSPNFGKVVQLPEGNISICGTEILDDRDGQYYNTVQIGTQCWMAENLNIGTMITGTTEMANDSIIEKYCYCNSTANCDIYGGLYQWNEISKILLYTDNSGHHQSHLLPGHGTGISSTITGKPIETTISRHSVFRCAVCMIKL
jgi:hypothetical protein